MKCNRLTQPSKVFASLLVGFIGLNSVFPASAHTPVAQPAQAGAAWLNSKSASAADSAQFPYPVKAGLHPKGYDVFVCRHTYDDGTFAGKAHWDRISRQMKCNIAHNGAEVQHKPGGYDELRTSVPDAAVWVPVADMTPQQLSSFALPVGTATLPGTSAPTPIYACQMLLRGKDGIGVHAGWFDASRRECHISWAARDVTYPGDKALILTIR